MAGATAQELRDGNECKGVVPCGATRLRFHALVITSQRRLRRRARPPRFGIHPGARQQWSSHPRSTHAHHAVHSPRPRLPSCSQRRRHAWLHARWPTMRYRMDMLHRCTSSSSSSLTQTSFIQNSYLADSQTRHRIARSTRPHTDHVTHATHLHSFSACSSGSPMLTQISERIDPGYTGFNGATSAAESRAGMRSGRK